MILMSPTVPQQRIWGIASRATPCPGLHVFSRRNAEEERSHEPETTGKQSKTVG